MKIFATLAVASASVVFVALTSKKMKPEATNTTIVRIWRGWTTLENAAKLESALRDEAIPSIERNRPVGLNAINLLILRGEKEVQFTTMMYFDSIESVKKFAGEKYEHAHIDNAVAPLLLRYDKIVEHHTLMESRVWNRTR